MRELWHKTTKATTWRLIPCQKNMAKTTNENKTKLVRLDSDEFQPDYAPMVDKVTSPQTFRDNAGATVRFTNALHYALQEDLNKNHGVAYELTANVQDLAYQFFKHKLSDEFKPIVEERLTWSWTRESAQREVERQNAERDAPKAKKLKSALENDDEFTRIQSSLFKRVKAGEDKNDLLAQIALAPIKQEYKDALVSNMVDWYASQEEPAQEVEQFSF